MLFELWTYWCEDWLIEISCDLKEEDKDVLIEWLEQEQGIWVCGEF